MLEISEISITKYLLNHWQGSHSLVKAFWINSVLIFGVFNLLLEQISALNNPATIITYARLYLLLTISFFLVVFPWQIVGLARTLLRYFKSKDGQFFVSYYRHGADANGPVSECMYMRIDRNGDLVDIGEKYTTKYGVSRFFDKLEMITF